MVKEEDLIYCEKYKCKLFPQKCVERYIRSNSPDRVKSTNGYFFVQKDLGCQNCKEGEMRLQTRGGTMEEKEREIDLLKEKVCKNPGCPESGKTQPVENFAVSASRRKKGRYDFYMDYCKVCMLKRQVEAKHLRKKRQKELELEYKKKEVEGEVTIDFKGREDLYEDLKKLAEAEFRTVSNQILYMLKKSQKERASSAFIGWTDKSNTE